MRAIRARQTTTAVGAALARFEGMPRRVLCLSPKAGKGWYRSFKKRAGIPISMGADSGAIRLYNAIANKNVATKISKRLRFVDVEDADNMKVPRNELPFGYGVVVIDDYSPEELKDMDTNSLKELQNALVDKEAFFFLKNFAQHVDGGYVVAVVTTTCKYTLRLLHHGIDEAKAAPFTLTKGPDSVDVEIPRDHVGMPWDRAARMKLFSTKYSSLAATLDGMEMVNQFADSDMKVRDCCKRFVSIQRLSLCHGFPGLFDYANDMDSIRRFISCQPACSVVDTTAVADEDVEIPGYHQMV